MGACYLMLAALGQAVTLRIAYLEGRGDRRRKGHAGRAISGCGLALMLGLAVAFVFGNESIARLAAASIGESDAALIARTAALAPFAGLALAAAVPAHVVCAWLRAQGRTAEPLALLVAGHWGIGLVAMLLLARAGFGAEGIWLGLGLGAAAASAFGLIRVRKTPQALRRSHSALFEAG
jgi:multidrug resistance protein, MATE family